MEDKGHSNQTKRSAERLGPNQSLRSTEDEDSEGQTDRNRFGQTRSEIRESVDEPVPLVRSEILRKSRERCRCVETLGPTTDRNNMSELKKVVGEVRQQNESRDNRRLERGSKAGSPGNEDSYKDRDDEKIRPSEETKRCKDTQKQRERTKTRVIL